MYYFINCYNFALKTISVRYIVKPEYKKWLKINFILLHLFVVSSTKLTNVSKRAPPRISKTILCIVFIASHGPAFLLNSVGLGGQWEIYLRVFKIIS